MPEKKSGLGIWITLLKLIFKFAGKALATLAQLFKFGKVGVAISFGVYSAIFNWKFASVLLFSLFVHEYGHVWAMKRAGMRIQGMYFIPFLGAVAVGKGDFPSRSAEVKIALMGPLWGFTLTLATYGVYEMTREPIVAAIAGWMALINIFNLLPIMPLDGGRVFRNIALSFTGWTGVLLFLGTCALSLHLAMNLGLSLIWIVIILGLFESVRDLFRSVRNNRRQQMAEDLAPLFGVEPQPKAVAAALLQLNEEYKKCLVDRQDGKFVSSLTDNDLTDYPLLSRERIRIAAAQGWREVLILKLDTDANNDAQRLVVCIIPTLFRPLGDLLKKNLRNTSWLVEGDVPNQIFSELHTYTGNGAPLSRVGIAASALAYIILTIALFSLLFATKHVPGADMAFAVFVH